MKLIKAKLQDCFQLFQEGRIDDADLLLSELLSINDRLPDALLLRGVIAGVRGHHSSAEQFLRRAAGIEHRNHYIFFNLAKALSEQGKDRESLDWHNKALMLENKHDNAWLNYGRSLLNLNEIDKALEAFDKALVFNRCYPEAWSNKGICLTKKGSYKEALECHDEAIKLDSSLAEAFNNRGITLDRLRDHYRALQDFEKAIHLKPDYAEAWSNLGGTLSEIGNYVGAINCFQRALELKPELGFALGELLHTKMKICDWKSFDLTTRELISNIRKGHPVSNPFPILGIIDSPRLQRKAVEIFVAKKFDAEVRSVSIKGPARRDKIRIGYFSMDFREHPIAFLTMDMFESHNRTDFEVYGFSFGVDTGDTVRRRIEKVFDHFFDVKDLSDAAVVALSRELEIDIAVDLGGYTRESRAGIFFRRAAPIQINYLGYLGTMGMKGIDYIIGDRFVIDHRNRSYFTEKIICLPNSFLPPSRHRISPQSNSQYVIDLPVGSFVFCCLNNNWKITPSVFRRWMKILRAVPNSVLWLYVDNTIARDNLKREASDLGVLSERLIFSERLPLQDYLSQFQFADLFLDTFPYNAGTTASDALWAGLPVLTRTGRSFASRVATGLLFSAGLPELIAASDEEYDSLAIQLATDSTMLTSLRSRLSSALKKNLLGSVEQFTKQIEIGYQVAHERLVAGLSPEDIKVYE